MTRHKLIQEIGDIAIEMIRDRVDEREILRIELHEVVPVLLSVVNFT